MNSIEKYNLITTNLQEILKPELLKKILEKRNLKIYWGTAPTGKIHIGYLIPLTKIADFLNAESEVIILLGDLHAFLDSQKTPEKLLKQRTKYYEIIIKATLKALGVNIHKLKFITGTSFQLKENYTKDIYRLTSIITISEARRAGSEVVKQMSNPKLSPLLYPILQSLDEEYLGVDAQFGGIDQRKIFTLANDFLPKINYKQRIHLMNPLLPGLTGSKMSASDEHSKIDLLDSEKDIRKKINKSFCPAGTIENNGILSFIKYVLFPYLKRNNRRFVIDRDIKFGGKLEFNSYKELENSFLEGLHPLDLKKSVANLIIEILEPIKQVFEKEENKKILNEAYP